MTGEFTKSDAEEGFETGREENPFPTNFRNEKRLGVETYKKKAKAAR